MIGALIEGKHKTEPILIITFLGRTPEPVCIFMRRNATLGFAPISEISMDWHYDENLGFMADSETGKEP